MCGIAGYFGRKTISDNQVNRTLGLMKRRGPNGQVCERVKVTSEKNCYLLHSRLSIIDLEQRSDQPFHYNDKILIFNGEIYNYLEIKEELKKLGHTFITKSDTEVFIHALDEWGTDALNKCEGMWGFALYDVRQKTLTLSRDPFGEKPLYVYEPEPGEVYFGSEIKFLSSLSDTRFRPNLNHISRFLVNGYKSLFKSNETFFLNVHPVPRASFMVICPKQNPYMTRYWHPNVQTDEGLTFQDAVSRTRDLLIKSVELRLRSDIPIAFCMSGGVDSNSLISIAKKVLNYDVHGFTILNKDERYEEQDMIDCSVRELGVKHSGHPVTDEVFMDNLRDIVCYHDAPVITISFYLNWLLQKEIAKHGYHISISGTAADEMFSGYFDHQLFYMYDVQNNPDLLSKSIHNWQRDVQPGVRNPLLQDPHTFIKNPFSREHAYFNNHKYASYSRRPWQEPFNENYFRHGLLQNRMMNEIFHETTPVSLHEDDLNAMYFSIENRAPFLDRKLYEFCNSIPAAHLIKDGKAKAVLREAMRGIVPDQIINNKRKVGFNAPIKDLIGNLDGLGLDDDNPIWEILDRQKVLGLLNQSNLPNSDSKFLFSFLSIKTFLKEFS